MRLYIVYLGNGIQANEEKDNTHMARAAIGGMNAVESTHKRTSQGGLKVKKASMNKSKKRSYKKYRGQGR